MKKYFIVKDEAIEAQYDEAMHNEEIMRQAFVQMREEYGINTHEFYLSRDRFNIVYNSQDREKFKDQMTVSGDFKKSSPMNKRWLELLKEKGITRVNKPFIPFIVPCSGGKYRSQIFRIDDVLYCTLEGEKVGVPDGWVELKASEYHKVIEDYEAKHEEGQDGACDS